MAAKEKDSSNLTDSKPEPLHPKYAVIRNEGWTLMVEASSSYDKALITLTTAFLGFIFAVIKLSPLLLHSMPLLIFILVCLIVAIFCSLMSFWFDQLYGDSIINYAHKFYIEDNNEYRTKKHWSYYASLVTKILAGALFILALILFSIFLFSNFESEKVTTINQPRAVSSLNENALEKK